MKLFEKDFIKKQLKALCDDQDINVRQLSQKLGMPYQTLLNYASGSRQPKWDLLQTLHNSIGLNLAWFVTGQGPMYGHQLTNGTAEEGATYNVKSEREMRLVAFIQDWIKEHEEAEQAWLEVQLARAVPEYGDYLKKIKKE